ncbi:hypothetical protein C8J57DRAFT_239936 [Mycena rebaudengoi]|nr:hypothetical protein C8J57DRAFT_239936 [Mycena rebaudengoi]
MSAFCSIRLFGDLSLFVSFPLLLSRIVSSKEGRNGVSVVTQVLHFIVFFTRYLDLFLKPDLTYAKHSWMLYWYNPLSKTYVLVMSAWVVIAIAYRFSMDRSLDDFKQSSINVTKFFRTVTLFTVPSFLLALLINYRANFYDRLDLSATVWSANLTIAEWKEVAWSMSHYLAGVCDIPQYMTYYSYLGCRQSHERWLLSSLAATVAFRHFYIPHWIFRFAEQGVVDPIAGGGAIVQIVSFWVFMVMCRNRLRNNTLPADEEAPSVKGEFGEGEILFDAKM